MKALTLGKRVIPIWLVAVLLVSAIASTALGYVAWTTLTIPVEVNEPIEILDYPSMLSLFPGDTKQFSVSIENKASHDYNVFLEFDLDDSQYQSKYVTFSDEVYTIQPGQHDISAWFRVKSNSPTLNTTLTVHFNRVESLPEEGIYFKDFNDGNADGWTPRLGSWNVINGEYFVSVGIVENGISTVNGLNLTDCIIETQLRFTDSVGYEGGIVFRYLDNSHYYAFQIGNEYDHIEIIEYSPVDPEYGDYSSRAFIQPLYGNNSIPINRNVNYTLRIEIQGTNFSAYLDGRKVLSWTDNSYSIGLVGLRARRADVNFDYFNVTSNP